MKQDLLRMSWVKVLGIVVLAIVIALGGLYVAGRWYFRPSRVVSHVLGFELPQNASVVTYEEEESFHGDGLRYYVIQFRGGTTQNTPFDLSGFISTPFTAEEQRLIQDMQEQFPSVKEYWPNGIEIRHAIWKTGDKSGDIICVWNQKTEQYILLCLLR